MRRARRPLSRAARLTKEWLGFYTNVEPESPLFSMWTIVPNSIQAAWIISPQDALGVFDEPTVMRILISMVTSNQESTGTNESNFAMIGIIAANALPTDPEYTPDPMANMDFDWIWSAPIHYIPESAGSLIGNTGSNVQGWENVKTRRRLDAGQGLALVAVGNQNNTSNLGMGLVGRILYAH